MSTTTPDYASLNVAFQSVISSLIPPSFKSVTKPPLDVDKVVQEERERRDRVRRRKEEKERQETVNDESKAAGAGPFMSASLQRKLSAARSTNSINAAAGPSSQARPPESSSDEEESRASVVKKRKISTVPSVGMSKKRKKHKEEPLQPSGDGEAGEQENRATPSHMNSFQLPTTDASAESLPPNHLFSFTTALPSTSTIRQSTPPPSELPNEPAFAPSTPQGQALSKSQRKRLRKKEKKAVQAAGS